MPTRAVLPNRYFSSGNQTDDVASGTLAGAIDTLGILKMFPRKVEIFGDGEPAAYIYKITSGMVRTYNVFKDGRRHVGAFYLPGDIVGLAVEDAHTFSAETTTRSKMLVVKRSAFAALVANNGNVAHQCRAQTVHETLRVQRHSLMLNMTAKERVVAFLLEILERMPASHSLDLKMTRQDIADYTGLTIETVSRMLAHLEIAAAIEMPMSRRIVLCNRSVLNGLIRAVE